MKYKVFVDGQEGTTGLKINERLMNRDDLEILKIDSDKRKDIETRRAFLNAADIVFLCLPDAASREAVSLVDNSKTKIIDASTAFRTHEDWVYGLPELSREYRGKIKASRRVANPGCYATGFNAAVYPLFKKGVIAENYPLTCHAVSGYSGGGKKLIEQFQNIDKNPKLLSPLFYALSLNHKHLPEMQKVNNLTYPPIFTPIVANYYQGMTVAVPITSRLMNKKLSAAEVQELLAEHYASEKFVRVMPFEKEYTYDSGLFNATECNDTNRLDIFVFGTDEQVLLLSRLDNLGKGASGAAVQNMNIMLGLDEGIGLTLGI